MDDGQVPGTVYANPTVLEARPAQVLLFGPEDRVGDELFPQVGPGRTGGVSFVQPPGEQQVGDLRAHRQRVGDAARPEGILDPVHLLPDRAGEQRSPLCVSANACREGISFIPEGTATDATRQAS